jgi:hypothetical protein
LENGKYIGRLYFTYGERQKSAGYYTGIPLFECSTRPEKRKMPHGIAYPGRVLALTNGRVTYVNGYVWVNSTMWDPGWLTVTTSYQENGRERFKSPFTHDSRLYRNAKTGTVIR